MLSVHTAIVTSAHKKCINIECIHNSVERRSDLQLQIARGIDRHIVIFGCGDPPFYIFRHPTGESADAESQNDGPILSAVYWLSW